jgi:hypothetical protein
MNQLWDYGVFGWKHIISVDALDHLCYLLAIAVFYLLAEWRKVLILLTAFTVGHALSICLSAMQIMVGDSFFIELLIPLTIVIASIHNLMGAKPIPEKQVGNKYVVTLFFGIIHGLGYAGILTNMLGKEQSLFIPLLGFNLGIEVAQILVTALVLILSTMALRYFQSKHYLFVRAVSAITLMIGIWMLIDRWNAI